LRKYLSFPKLADYVHKMIHLQNFSSITPFFENFLTLNSIKSFQKDSDGGSPKQEEQKQENIEIHNPSVREQIDVMDRIDALTAGLYLLGGSRDVLRVGSRVAVVSSKDRSVLKTAEGPSTLTSHPYSLPYFGCSATLSYFLGGQLPWQWQNSGIPDTFGLEKNVGVVTSLCPFWPVADVSIQNRVRVCPLKNLQAPSDFYSGIESVCFPLPPQLLSLFSQLFQTSLSFCFPLSSFHCVQETLMTFTHLRSTAMRVCMSQTACPTAMKGLVSSPAFADIFRIASVPATLARRYGDGSLEVSLVWLVLCVF
jgi:hypothetical protein